MEQIEILPEDLEFIDKHAPFHLFHKWSKWYRISIKFYEKSDLFILCRQQRHCLLCNKLQRRDIGSTN